MLERPKSSATGPQPTGPGLTSRDARACSAAELPGAGSPEAYHEDSSSDDVHANHRPKKRTEPEDSDDDAQAQKRRCVEGREWRKAREEMNMTDEAHMEFREQGLLAIQLELEQEKILTPHDSAIDKKLVANAIRDWKEGWGNRPWSRLKDEAQLQEGQGDETNEDGWDEAN